MYSIQPLLRLWCLSEGTHRARWDVLHLIPFCAKIQLAAHIVLPKPSALPSSSGSSCLSLPQVVARTALKQWVALRAWLWCPWSPRPPRAPRGRASSPATSSPCPPSKSRSWPRPSQVRSLPWPRGAALGSQGCCVWVLVDAEGSGAVLQPGGKVGVLEGFGGVLWDWVSGVGSVDVCRGRVPVTLGAVGELSWFLPHLRGFCAKTFSEPQQHILSGDGHSQGVCSAWSGI